MSSGKLKGKEKGAWCLAPIFSLITFCRVVLPLFLVVVGMRVVGVTLIFIVIVTNVNTVFAHV